MTDVNQIERAIAAGEEELNAKRHPDPYIRAFLSLHVAGRLLACECFSLCIGPYSYGGSKYARNAGIPEHVDLSLSPLKERDRSVCLFRPPITWTFKERSPIGIDGTYARGTEGIPDGAYSVVRCDLL